ncbi:class I SAM-dependent methyltransferase [Cumulibacter manganitolerans]|uniref:class I SAM-dependent methyltransferase n=1 Tax=Cumulibacter manganitolerans TaxID=1884992 RepID=UPI0012962E54|nr:class I SAM-dependent methyltransferase [Cumulibacter manganitolerans]
MTASRPTRWDLELVAHQDKWQAYVDRFSDLHESGADTAGEARFIDALADRGSTILDAGCGAGRVGAVLLRAGHRVAGVDKDAGHIALGRERYPDLPLLAADLLTLAPDVLSAAGLPTEYDIVALAGNVMVYLAPGTEAAVLASLTRLLRPGGRLVTGFAIGRDYTPEMQDADAAAAGLALQHRFATWQLAPFDDDAGWAVSVYRR